MLREVPVDQYRAHQEINNEIESIPLYVPVWSLEKICEFEKKCILNSCSLQDVEVAPVSPDTLLHLSKSKENSQDIARRSEALAQFLSYFIHIKIVSLFQSSGSSDFEEYVNSNNILCGLRNTTSIMTKGRIERSHLDEFDVRQLFQASKEFIEEGEGYYLELYREALYFLSPLHTHPNRIEGGEGKILQAANLTQYFNIEELIFQVHLDANLLQDTDEAIIFENGENFYPKEALSIIHNLLFSKIVSPVAKQHAIITRKNKSIRTEEDKIIIKIAESLRDISDIERTEHFRVEDMRKTKFALSAHGLSSYLHFLWTKDEYKYILFKIFDFSLPPVYSEKALSISSEKDFFEMLKNTKVYWENIHRNFVFDAQKKFKFKRMR